MAIEKLNILPSLNKNRRAYFIDPVNELGMQFVCIDPEPGIDSQGIAIDPNNGSRFVPSNLAITFETAHGYNKVDITIHSGFIKLNDVQQRVALRYIALRLDTYIGQKEMRFTIDPSVNILSAHTFEENMKMLSAIPQIDRLDFLIATWPRF